MSIRNWENISSGFAHLVKANATNISKCTHFHDKYFKWTYELILSWHLVLESAVAHVESSRPVTTRYPV